MSHTTTTIHDWGSLAPLIALLGQPREAEQVEQFIEALGVALPADPSARSHHYGARALGLALYEEQGRMHSLFLYGGDYEDFDRYEGLLPESITFEWTREQLLARFGPPERSGEPGFLPGGWARYVADGFRLHFTFSRASTIALLVIEPVPADA